MEDGAGTALRRPVNVRQRTFNGMRKSFLIFRRHSTTPPQERFAATPFFPPHPSHTNAHRIKKLWARNHFHAIRKNSNERNIP